MNLDGMLTAAYIQNTPSTHGANIASRYGVRSYDVPFPREAMDRFPRTAQPYRVRQPLVGLQRAIAAFLTSAFAGTPTIDATGVDTLYDTDDDGWTDDEERRAGTSPTDGSAHPMGTPPHVRDVGF
jgi:hypothetical protein